MFGCQARATTVGLAVMFSTLATAASSTVTGTISRPVKKRAGGLERTFLEQTAAGRSLFLRWRVGNSYLSAKSFAEAIHERGWDLRDISTQGACRRPSRGPADLTWEHPGGCQGREAPPEVWRG